MVEIKIVKLLEYCFHTMQFRALFAINCCLETIESNETTQDSTTATSSTSVSSTELPPTTTTSLTSITTKPEVTVSTTELPPTTPFPKTTTTGFFGALTTPATVVALTGLVFLGVVPCFAIVIFCLRKKRKRPSRDNQSQYPYLKRDAHYYNTYHYPMTHKPLFYQYWGEYWLWIDYTLIMSLYM